MRKTSIRTSCPPAEAASPEFDPGACRRSSPGRSPAVSVLLLAALCFAPSCTPLLVDTGGFDLYGGGDPRQTAADRGGDAPAAGRRDALYDSSSARGREKPSVAGKKRAGRELYRAGTGKKDAAAPQASKRGDPYNRKGRGSSKAAAVSRKAARGAETYGGAAASRGSSPLVAEKGAEAGEALYEAGRQAKEPGREGPDQDRDEITSQQQGERDLYSVMRSAPRSAPQKKAARPQAVKGADRPPGQPEETGPERAKKIAAPPPSVEQETGEKAAEGAISSPPPPATAAPPPAPPATATAKGPVREPAGEKAAEGAIVSPPPPATATPPPAPPATATAKGPVREPAGEKAAEGAISSPPPPATAGPPPAQPAAAAVGEKKSTVRGRTAARKTERAADTTGKPGEDLYDRQAGGAGRGADNGGKAERGLDLYGDDRGRYPDADGSRMTAWDKDDLYSGPREPGPRKAAREEAVKPQAKRGVEQPSGQPVAGGTSISPPPAAAASPPPAPPAAAPGEKKSAPPETARPGASERERPPSAQRRPTPPAVAAAPEQMARIYPEQRREAEDLIGAGTRERPPGRGLLVVNRPPNIQGLTGLLFTNSAYTLPTGKFTVGASLLSEYSKRPEFSVLQIPVTLTYGLTDRMELGVKAKIVDLDSPTYPQREQGFGDSEISAKWRFSSRRFILPEMAVGLSYIAPTGNEDKHLNEVVNWGMKFMAIASLEGRTSGGRVLGIYAETQAVFIDELAKGGSSTPGAERYGIINGGVLIPVTADNRTQLLVEYSQIAYKSKLQPTMVEGNQNAGTAAIRYVTESFSTTAGVQYINKEQEGDQNTYRFVWKLSLTL